MIFKSKRNEGYCRRSGVGSKPNLHIMISHIIIAEHGSNGARVGVFCCVSSLQLRWSEYVTEMGILDSDSIPLTVWWTWLGDVKAAEMLLVNLTVIDLHFLLPFPVDAIAHHNLHSAVVRELLRVDSKVCNHLLDVFAWKKAGIDTGACLIHRNTHFSCVACQLGVTFRSYHFLSIDPCICQCQDCLQIGYNIGTNKLSLHLGDGMWFWYLWAKFGFKGQCCLADGREWNIMV